MPACYDFKCSECRHKFNVLLRKSVKLSSGVTQECPRCKARAVMMFPGPNQTHGLKFGVKLRHPETGKIFEPKVRK